MSDPWPGLLKNNWSWLMAKSCFATQGYVLKEQSGKKTFLVNRKSKIYILQIMAWWTNNCITTMPVSQAPRPWRPSKTFHTGMDWLGKGSVPAEMLRRFGVVVSAMNSKIKSFAFKNCNFAGFDSRKMQFFCFSVFLFFKPRKNVERAHSL